MHSYEELKLVHSYNGSKSFDGSLVYSLAAKGIRIAASNLKDLVAHNRFKTNSVTHDLQLLEIQNVLRQKKMVKEYFTENQMQTYQDFQFDEKLKPFSELHFDALIRFHDTKDGPVFIPLEFEANAKSQTLYKKRMSKIYYYKTVPAIFYVCANTQVENAIKKAESLFATNQKKKLYFITQENLMKSKESVTFINQDNRKLIIS